MKQEGSIMSRKVFSMYINYRHVFIILYVFHIHHHLFQNNIIIHFSHLVNITRSKFICATVEYKCKLEFLILGYWWFAIIRMLGSTEFSDTRIINKICRNQKLELFHNCSCYFTIIEVIIEYIYIYMVLLTLF